MLNRILIFCFLIVSASFILSCSSGKKQLRQGDYYEAVIKAVNRLRAKPNQKKAQETLRNSYPLSVDWYIDQAKNQVASNHPFKWKSVVNSYERINHMYEEIRKSPGALRVIPNPSNYYSELVDARNKAAEESYSAGLNALKLESRETAKQAYFNFMDADRFVPGYKDVKAKIDEAKFYATLKVVVEQIPVPSLRYKVSADFFQEKIQEFLHSYNNNEFVRYYSPREAQSENLKYPDQIVRLQFKDFVVGETHTKEVVENLVKDSVKVGEVAIKQDSIIDVYGQVKAKLTTFRKEVVSTGVMNMVILNAKNKSVLSSENFGGEFVWFSQWGYFNGDERALTPAQSQMCKQKEVPPPPPQDLFIAFTEPIYDQLTRNFRAFYSRY